MKKENRLFVALYSEDAFMGITIPYELKEVIEYLHKNSRDTIDEIFDDYDEYRDCEVEMASYAKDGSDGTKDIDTIDDLISIFNWNKSIIKKIEDFQIKK